MVRQTGLPRVYIATAQAFDGEMAARIAMHREDRGPDWETLEAPEALAATLAEVEPGRAVLVDCLTLWLSNLMLAGRDIAAGTEALLAVLAEVPGPVVLVSNELGMGLVPETALGRTFRDAQGRLNQQVAAAADRVVFVAAGLPLVLKGGG
ncbi:bifunctional adenosylcobinamide kinase/adenosylcobinamide-phosphate guanylyltransferase [Paroceanicella profunda]|nr:bifunctional adenosylcobinamide kinase/adenosylcobinamide-phosphate guanylyltransferase [Paroceanicella profunda]